MFPPEIFDDLIAPLLIESPDVIKNSITSASPLSAILQAIEIEYGSLRSIRIISNPESREPSTREENLGELLTTLTKIGIALHRTLSEVSTPPPVANLTYENLPRILKFSIAILNIFPNNRISPLIRVTDLLKEIQAFRQTCKTEIAKGQGDIQPSGSSYNYKKLLSQLDEIWLNLSLYLYNYEPLTYPAKLTTKILATTNERATQIVRIPLDDQENHKA